MKILLSTVLALLPVGALAADLPNRAAALSPETPVAAITWTGLFVGAQMGWQQHRNSFADIGFGNEAGRNTFVTSQRSSFIGGGHIGYNHQIGNVVLGVVADFDLGGTNLGFDSNDDWAYQQKIRAQGSVRGRVGYAAGRFLPYLTAGAAVADISTIYAFNSNRQSISETKVGWTAGAGVEYAIDSRWSARIEYLYTDFGRFTHYPTVWTVDYLNKHHVTAQSARVGASYRF